MPKEVPKTYNKAMEAGHKPLTTEEVEKHLASRAVARSQDGGSQPGDKCSETNCIDGFKIVLYRDSSGGCTRAVKIPC